MGNKVNYITVTHDLWLEWLLSFGAIIAVSILSVFMSKTWLPAVTLGIAWALNCHADKSMLQKRIKCVRLAKACVYSLVSSSFIMGICLLVVKTRLTSIQSLNPNLPYLSSLIVYPSLFACCILVLLRLGKGKDCQACINRMDLVDGREINDDMVHARTKQMLKTLAAMSLLLMLISYFYYCLWYSNANINGRDKYVLLMIPCVLYVGSLFVEGRKTHLLQQEIKRIYANDNLNHKERLRFLVICGGKLLLSLHHDEKTVVDTPFESIINISKTRDNKDALEKIESMTGAHALALKYLYSSGSIDTGFTRHYAVFADNESDIKSDLPDCRWYTLDQINRLWKTGNVAPDLSAEIYRIFTISMAWKTYDRSGYRLYPIKNYRPTFRLGDLKDWNVNFDDNIWLKIAHDNQDRPFFKTRRFFNRLTSLKKY